MVELLVDDLLEYLLVLSTLLALMDDWQYQIPSMVDFEEEQFGMVIS